MVTVAIAALGVTIALPPRAVLVLKARLAIRISREKVAFPVGLVIAAGVLLALESRSVRAVVLALMEIGHAITLIHSA